MTKFLGQFQIKGVCDVMFYIDTARKYTGIHTTKDMHRDIISLLKPFNLFTTYHHVCVIPCFVVCVVTRWNDMRGQC